MSVLEIYINWVNSVLGETGSHVTGVEAVQDGKLLCELIDVLAPDSGLLATVKASGDCTPIAYINAALEHMENHGIKIKFPAQDIVHNEIKSMLDVLWLLILNYGIHFIGQNAFQRSVGIGKKNLLEWCQEELGTTFDSKNTLSYNLCNGSWFIKLLEKKAGCSMSKSEDKTEYIDALLSEIQDRYLIEKDIIKANDIVDGTVDEHTLMIYLSLLKRRMSYSERRSIREMYSTDGKAAAMAKVNFFEQRAKSLHSSTKTQRSKSVDAVDHGDRRARSLSSGGRSSSANSDRVSHQQRSTSQSFADGNETSDWSSTGSLFSGKEKSSPERDHFPQDSRTSDILDQVISDKVVEHLPAIADSDQEVGKEANSQRVSEKEMDTMSDHFPTSLVRQSSLPEGTMSEFNQLDAHANVVNITRKSPQNINGNGQTSSLETTGYSNRWTDSMGQRDKRSSSPAQRYSESQASSRNGDGLMMQEQMKSIKSMRSSEEQNVRIKIKRPKDYILQWEDTMDRLSVSSALDEPSPRPPLISKFETGFSTRSKSSEIKSCLRSHQYSSSTRSKSSDLQPKYSSLSSQALLHTSSSGRQFSSSMSNGISSDDRSLESVLEQLPQHIQQEAAEASKFLMHNSGPEVLALINAIKHIQESVHSTVPKEEYRYARAESSTSQGSSQVRFQNESRQQPSSYQFQSSVSRIPTASLGRHPEVSDNDLIESCDVMLSISPKNRSRSLSPTNMPSNQCTDTGPFARSLRVRDQSDGGSGSRSLQEELLIRNLGFNTRVAEDERPSSRIIAMVSSSRQDSYTQDHQSFPRKPQSVQTKTPEVTALDLGLDSDRSYASQADDMGEKITPKQGGYGRVPRREAWEQQRRKRDEAIPASTEDESAAQSKFIDVLVKEITLLKHKVELIEEEGDNRGQTRPVAGTDALGNNTRMDLRVHKSEFASAPHANQSVSPGRDRSNSCPLLETSSRSPLLSTLASLARDNTRLKQTISSSSHRVKRGDIRTSSAGHGSEEIPRLSLGYNGPAHSITPEIWGNDLSSPNGLDPDRQINWKRLISSRNLTEVIELKQALACAVVEIDILQAKLNNARHEIHDKLRHTNEVLDDCRHHLAKSQAENMELRSKMEQERQRTDVYEGRIKELENNVFEARQDSKQLESELGETSILLDKSLVKTKPGVEVLKGENAHLISRLANVENEKECLEDDVQRFKRNQTKSMNTMDELRECLRKVRRERQELIDEIETIQLREQSARVQEIIHRYQEKGNLDENQCEEENRRSAPSLTNLEHLDSDEGVFSGSQASYDQQFHSNLHSGIDESPIRRSTELNSRLRDLSFTSSPCYTPRTSSQYRSTNAESPPPINREIYPHRKNYQPRSRSCSPQPSHDYFSSLNQSFANRLDDSIVDFTLQEIERDVKKERRNSLNNASPQHPFSYHENLSNERNIAPSSRIQGISTFETTPDKNSYSSTPQSQRVRKDHMPARGRSYNRLNRSFSPSQSRYRPRNASLIDSPHPGILKGRNRLGSRSRSPSYIRDHSLELNRNNRKTAPSVSGYVTPERSPSPVYFPRQCHSPPTRLSPENKDKTNTSLQKRPRHAKSQPGEIARNLQEEFDKEDKSIDSLSKSSVLRNESWFEVQRKKTPILTEEQRRYADKLIEKYTGNAPK